MTIDHTPRTVWLLIAAATVAHLVQLSLFSFPLFGDEAQYWTWAQQPDFGYYSKPPVVAWSIAVTTGVFGDSEFAIRLPSLLFHAVIAWGMYLLGRDMFNARVGFWSAVVWLTLPAVTVSTVAVSTDPPMLTAWVFCLWAFYRATQDPGKGWRWWALAGVMGGVGMMSKYPMIALPTGFVIYLFFSRQTRQSLNWVGFFGAAVIALAVFTPNILWNAQHGFVSLLHLGENANVGGALFNIDELGEFWAGQAGVFGPALFVLFVWLVITARRVAQDDRYLLLLCVALPIFVVISAQGFLSRANANWASPTYIGATVLVVAWALEQGKPRWITWSVMGHVTLAVIMTGLAVLSARDMVALSKGVDPFRRLKSWDTAAQEIAAAGALDRTLPLVFDHRITLAHVLYYGQPDNPVMKWNPDPYVNDHYELTTQLTPAETPDVLLVVRTETPFEEYGRFFDTLEVVETIDVPQGYRRLYYNVVRAEGFQGYDFQRAAVGTE